MEMPEWRSEYAVGHPLIDEQHRQLFGIAARLGRACEKDKDTAIISEIVRELVAYADQHFEFEEGVMEAADYDHSKYHRAMHEYMRARLDLLEAQLAKKLLSLDELTEFMETWLTEHIIMEDMRYIPALAAKQARGGFP